jgi:transcription elongation factor GreA
MREIIDKLEAELKPLERELRVELPREIKTAVAMGDLRENAEYKAALERQAFVKARIGQLRERLSALGSIKIDQVPRDRVGLGATVKLLDLDTDKELTYRLVFPEIADLEKGLLSVASPIGRALMGKQAGDCATVEIPSGTREFEILELKTVHDEEGREDEDGERG